MSQFAISQYLIEVEKIYTYGGTKKETAIRNAFYNLLNEYAKAKGLMIVAEVTIKGVNGKNVTPDGTLKDALRQDWGYWESKDEADKIDDEIKKKFEKGYPKDNILFEDSQTAVLYQNGAMQMRESMKDPIALDKIINAFLKFERPEIRDFRKAIELFKRDIPTVTTTIRKIIEDQTETNAKFNLASKTFLKLCIESINPDVTMADVREMIIQHILTEDIFNSIFDETQFHRENNIAHELEKVINTFFTGVTKRAVLSNVKHYYDAINAAAAGIADHHEKQKFLKVVYETFYKSYNPKAADRLGVVYTPNEVVRFMVESTDFLLHKHFNKLLEDKGVEILDPATGTGTFICDIIDYIRKEKVAYKYSEELHANEVAILPYYISNLNIEYTYKQKTGQYKEFANLCFVDTLDNMGFGFAGKQLEIFSALTKENSKRINKQNGRKISVLIGNPPYNANQMNENDNNKNRGYDEIDKRIKDSFIKYSTAQKTKVYDMYARFYRWAFDRLDSNGIIAFITNRSFIDSRTFDGFRKCVQEDFDYAYIIDTQSDIRVNPKLSGNTHNIFGIQTGVAIMFLVKKAKQENKKCMIKYVALDDFWRKEVKLQWLTEHPFREIAFDNVAPDKNNNWIKLADTDFESLIPLADKNVKLGKSEEAVFKLYSLGVATNRDEWVYDLDKTKLQNKVTFFCEFYEKEKLRWENSNKKTKINNFVDRTIKWTEELENHLIKGTVLSFDEKFIRNTEYRPFTKQTTYASKTITHRPYQQNHIFPFGQNDSNIVICLSGTNSSKPFQCLATNKIAGLDFLEKTQCLPYYRYDSTGNKTVNITDWGLAQFTKHYKKKKITKEDIFYYSYAVLHNPAYRLKYGLNLKREFPRLPFYKDFFKWAGWGKALMELHLNYETAPPYELKETSKSVVEVGQQNRMPNDAPRVKLKAVPAAGIIEIDEDTILAQVPIGAWQYKLGNRSAIEWVLDQYKEKQPKDPTVAAKFNTYRFADYKPQVIDLIKRVTTVSVETIKIINEMEEGQ